MTSPCPPSLVIAAIDAGHYEKSANHVCYKCRVTWPCPTMTGAVRQQAEVMRHWHPRLKQR